MQKEEGMAIVGIDLGTSNSLACLWTDAGAVLVPNGLGEVLTPSAVSIDEDGSLLVGRAARERLVTAPQHTTSEFKRFMGTDKRYSLGDRRFTPEELSSFILRKLKKDAETWLSQNRPGEAITEAVVSVPAYFNDNQRAATKRAGLLAGLTVDRLLNEPSAAALACRQFDQQADYTALVFDFGGGTLDVSIVDCFDNMVSVLAVAGNNRLGGIDFDRQIARAFCLQNHIFFEHLSPFAKASLLSLTEEAKKNLSKTDATTLTVALEGANGSMELTNQRLVEICEPIFASLALPVRRALVDSRKSLQDIERIVMVGGSCKMPVVQEYLRQLFGRELDSPIAPDTMVGTGAGVYAGIRERHGQVRDIVMTDLCPFTLGTGVAGNVQSGPSLMSPIIERNSVLPCSKTHQYFTVREGQTTIKTGVYQGEERYCQDNLELGSVSVPVPSGPKGEEGVNVRFSYDINGILEVEVSVISTSEARRAVFIGKDNTMTEEEVKARLEELSSLKLHPHNMEEVRVLVARGERLYAQSMGVLREETGFALDRFQATVEQGAPTDIARASIRFKAFLGRVEEQLLGYGLFPSDQNDDWDDGAIPDEEEVPRVPGGKPAGGNSGTPLQ